MLTKWLSAKLCDDLGRNVQSIGLILVFVLCQVVGIMCALPDVAIAEQPASFVQDVMVCPMDGTLMCPPSAISSPERQEKQGSAADVDHAAILSATSLGLLKRAMPTLGSSSSTVPIVPISISSSSVLRI